MGKNQFFSGSFRSKVTVALVLSLFLIAAISNFLIYKFSYNSQFEQFREELDTTLIFLRGLKAQFEKENIRFSPNEPGSFFYQYF